MKFSIFLVGASAAIGCWNGTAQDTSEVSAGGAALQSNLIAEDVFADYLAADATSITAISTTGVYRVAKGGRSTGAELVFSGPVPAPALARANDGVFWTTGGTALTKFAGEGLSTFAQVGISASLGPVSASDGSVYWIERKYADVDYLRSEATTNQRELLQRVSIDEAFVSDITGIGDCVFAVVSGTGPDRIDRVCSTGHMSDFYVGSSSLVSLAADNSSLYFIEDGVGLRRLAPIDSNTPEVTTLVEDSVTRAILNRDFVYFIRDGRRADRSCGVDSSIDRIPKEGGAIDHVVPGPLACPTDIVLDEGFLYWSEAEGTGAVRRIELLAP